MHLSPSSDVTQLLQAVQDGDQEAVNLLFPLIYDELHAQAQRQRRQWQGHYTLNTTALVHEAYLKLLDGDDPAYASRAHFLSVAAKAMRHILIDYARQMQRQKRGGDVQKMSLEQLGYDLGRATGSIDLGEKADEIVALGEALQDLQGQNPRQAQVVECRYFGGMTIPDTAEALGISPATVKRDWVHAQAWLYRALQERLEG